MITVTNPERDPNDLRGVQVGGSFKIVRVLGAGGMGRVWLARASELDDKEAAVKVLINEALSKPEHMLRFKREVRAIGGLKSKGAVEIFDAGYLPDGRYYMIMEFCSGGSLKDLLDEKGRLGIEDTFIFLAGPAKALRAAHAAQMIHRDVKPDNILLVKEDDEDGIRAKLSDFGLAKLNSERLAGQFNTGTMRAMGTIGYAAPEQLNPEMGVDYRADIFSFGCVLYKCLTGKLPYPAGNVAEYCQVVWPNQAHPKRATNPRVHRSEISLELDALVMECIELDREKRPRSIEEVMRRFAYSFSTGPALLRFFAGSKFVDRRTAPTADTISETIGVAATQFVSEMTRSENQRRRGTFLRIAVVFFAGALLSGAAATIATQRWSRPASDCLAVAGPAPMPSAPTSPAPASQALARSDVAPGIAHTSPASIVPSASPPSAASSTARGDDAVTAPRASASTRIDAVPRAAPTDAHVSPRTAAQVPSDDSANAPRVSMTSHDSSMPIAPRAQHDSPQPDKSQRSTEKDKRTQQAAAQGTLHVEVQPWADVVIGDWQDTTPVTRPLPAGRHRVLLRKGTKTELVDVVITPNQTTTITRTW